MVRNSTSPQTTAPRVRRVEDAVAVLAGLAVLGAGLLAVRHGSVSATEESMFSAFNDLPGGLYPVLWPFQQLGALFVGPAVALVAVAVKRYWLALAALLATVAKLGSERVVKAMVSRSRPGTSIGADVETRGDVSIAGEGFVSGHAVLIAALAGLVSPYLHRRWKILPWVIVALVMVTRVYVGAHLPLDVICGAGLGVAIAGCLNLIFGVPAHRSEVNGSGG